MSIRFKFRSSMVYDSINLVGLSSISVRELRDKIVAHKKLQFCNDFKLLISDADTGKALDDDGIQVMEGSTVVIKRVPRDLNVGSVARNDVNNVERVAPSLPPPQNVGEDNLDVFSMELFPCTSNLKFTANQKDNVVPRCSETSLSIHQKIGGTDLCEEDIGDNCCKESNIGRIQKQIKLDYKKEVHPKLDQQTVIPLSTMLDIDLPAELRCSLCTSIFTDAVMIRCCQHSFCETCIRTTLLERGRCPKCSSMKYTVETLLPNLTLRQAIEHFLEAQAVNNALQNKIPHDIPDVESGIHAKEVSCAVSIRKNEPPYPHSSSATRRLSNQVVAGGMRKSAPLPLMTKQMKEDENSSAATWNRMVGFQGIQGSYKLPQNFLHEEVNMAVPTNRGIGVTVLDGSGTLMPSSRHRKGDRNCYMCGSPDHLMRDCPAGSNSYPFNQTGDVAFAGGMPMYGQAYWYGNTFPQARPYGNMYGNQGMMPFDPTMAPISPFGISPYMPCMYNEMPGTYGYARMGDGWPPMAPGMERPPRQAFVEPQDGKLKRKTLDGEQDFDNRPEDYYYKGPRMTSHEGRHQLDKVTAGSFSDVDSPRIPKKHPDNKHYSSSHRKPAIQSNEELPYAERRHERCFHQSVSGRDQLGRPSEKSNAEADYLSASSNWQGSDRKRHHHGICIKKQSERRGHHASEFSPKSQHRTRKDISYGEKVAPDHKKQSHRHHPESSFEPNVASDRRHHHKEKEASHSFRPSRQIPKSKDNRLEYERWEMKEGLGDEYRGGNHHRRRRTRHGRNH